jgi:hypothetical protein
MGGPRIVVTLSFHPAKALVLASNRRFTDFVAPESWM